MLKKSNIKHLGMDGRGYHVGVSFFFHYMAGCIYYICFKIITVGKFNF
jgi:hypothetical protein